MKKVFLFLKETFSKRKYSATFVFTSFVVFLFFLWTPNLSFIFGFLSSPEYTLPDKISFFFEYFKVFPSSFSTLSQITTIIISLLVGLNSALIVRFLDSLRKIDRTCSVKTGVGFFAGFLGIGCSSCGSFVLSLIFGAGVSSSILANLPFSGQEFAFASIALLSFSVISFYKKLSF
ncbi:hypothetical protein HRbin34_00119 [bacterium HR34]|nr:hypothetical protein HRbin34_00119 [bacterium HR34]